MIAGLIKSGYYFWPSEFGVRVFTILLTTLAIVILEKLVQPCRKTLFYLVILSLLPLHIYGFIAVPDAPLLFFTALFFYTYRRYTINDNTKNVIFLAFAIAGLLYSKYHGLLIIVFTLLSNLRLLRKRSFYLILLSTILFYLPHIIWQIQNDYPSFQYHIQNKSQKPYDSMDSINYILGQILIFGPLISWFLFYSLFKSRKLNDWERSLQFTGIGFLLFFLGSSFNSRVEPNWTVAILIPLVVLGWKYMFDNPKYQSIILKLCIPSIMVVFTARLLLVFNLIPSITTHEFFSWKERSAMIKNKTDGLPVAFKSTYQAASKYSFYAGVPTVSLNSWNYRRNQFDLWGILDSLKHQKVAIIHDWGKDENGVEKLDFEVVDDFVRYNRLIIEASRESYKFPADSMAYIELKVINTSRQPTNFQLDYQHPFVGYKIEHFGRVYSHNEKGYSLDGDTLNMILHVKLPIKTPKESGIYFIQFGINSDHSETGHNSRRYMLEVE
ncbi:MAG: hypothetical protein CL840_19085 [Crocinitomicaceae bacterium]|nr:hypothetical protein [Crocinitomicaceae bacterium]|tara:strand:- start:4884 stop:6374 length:1491 start_codon:yes stop_codon:yes gene_type:complete